jgi:uridine monophosphate synthetase
MSDISFLISSLFEIGAIKFGPFTLKSGLVSPFYIDLRLAFSAPELLSSMTKVMYEKVKEEKFDLICPVPYAAIPYGSVMSVQQNIPMILCRQEKKEYGLKKQIEGIFVPDQKCLLVEDVATSGQSIFETIVRLQKEQLIVNDIIVFIDREQGAKQHLESKGFHLHVVFTITEVIQMLLREEKINEQTANSIFTFIKNHKIYG